MSTRTAPQESATARIFISYRRQETAAYAAHLHDSLGRRFGRARVFRDVDTIAPGEDYPEVIERAIGATTVVIVLIGPRWVTIAGRNGGRRLEDPADFVRIEIETALARGVTLIPVLVGGAAMPAKEDLPATMAEFADRNAVGFGWHNDVARVGRQIAAAERERLEREAAAIAERERLDLSLGLEFGVPGEAGWATDPMIVVTKAMEISLQAQGQAIELCGRDIYSSLQKLSKKRDRAADIASQGYRFMDLVRVIDVIGVKAAHSAERYIARSYRLPSRDQIVGQLRLGRPVLAEATVSSSWFVPPTSADGRLVVSGNDQVQGGIVLAVLGWEPSANELTFLTPWPEWGDHGRGRMSVEASAIVIGNEIRSVEVVRMPDWGDV